MDKLSKDSKYLGNPIFIDRNYSKAYEELKRKVEAKLQGWKAKILSQANKFTHIKSVINATPFYVMIAYKFLTNWC